MVSGVFRNMLAIPTSDRIKNEQPIPVSASKEDFASLLAYATLDDVEHLSHWPTMGRVYELSEIYDFPAVRGRLIDRINRKKRTAPWETFVFAAQKRMLPLARSALGQMHREKDTLVTNADKIPVKEANACRPITWSHIYSTCRRVETRRNRNPRSGGPASLPGFGLASKDRSRRGASNATLEETLYLEACDPMNSHRQLVHSVSALLKSDPVYRQR